MLVWKLGTAGRRLKAKPALQPLPLLLCLVPGYMWRICWVTKVLLLATARITLRKCEYKARLRQLTHELCCRAVGDGVHKLSGYVSNVANLTEVAGSDLAADINSTVFNGCVSMPCC